VTVDSPSLAELQRRVTAGGGAGVAASLSAEAVLGRMSRWLDRQAADDREFRRAVAPVLIPSVLFPVSGAVVTVPPQAAALLGPEDGQVWDVRRISLAGWTGADNAIGIDLFREVGSGMLENFLQRFSGAVGNKTWAPGGGLILRSPESLSLGNSGTFTTTTGIMLTGEAIQVQADWLWKYLL
jgi:hypothetical protein